MITFSILFKNEFDELNNLLGILKRNVSFPYEVNVCLDGEGVTDDFSAICKKYGANKFFRKLTTFSEQRNYLNEKASYPHIFSLDPDEYLSQELISILPDILKDNSNCDLFWFPRINVINSIPNEIYNRLPVPSGSKFEDFREHVSRDLLPKDSLKYKWLKDNNFIIFERFDGLGNEYIEYYSYVLNYPDYQGRLYKNSKNIKWINPVHEVISGIETQTYIPLFPEYSIVHIKSWNKQVKQNQFYANQFPIRGVTI